MSDAIKPHYRWHFSFRKTAHWCTHALCVQDSPLLRRSRLPFSWTMPPTAPSWTYWLQELGSHTVVWVWVMSQKDCQNSSSRSLISSMYWYSIWAKNAGFVFPRFAGSAEAQVIWGGTVKRLLIAYFIGNISAKKCQNAFTYVKVIANQRWEVFWDTVYICVKLDQALSDCNNFWPQPEKRMQYLIRF